MQWGRTMIREQVEEATETINNNNTGNYNPPLIPILTRYSP